MCVIKSTACFNMIEAGLIIKDKTYVTLCSIGFFMGGNNMDFLLLIFGFLFLVKGADFFVDGASSIADHMKVPAIVVGLTIVAFGTSAPEAAVSITAGLAGSNAIAVGNVVGSNIFNLLVVLGSSAILKTVMVQKRIINFDLPVMIGSGILLTLFCFTGNVVSRIEGLILFVLILAYVAYTVASSLKSRHSIEVNEPKFNVPMSILISIIGLALIVFGGQWVVDSASSIARSFGLSETLIGLTIVSVGTSLPELVTSVVAARKGQSDIALGNVIGSNIFNILFIIGLSSLVNPIEIASVIFTDLAFMMVIFVLTLAVSFKQKCFDKKVGWTMVILFLIYLTYIIIRN